MREVYQMQEAARRARVAVLVAVTGLAWAGLTLAGLWAGGAL